MKSFGSNIGAVAGINVQLFGAFACGVIAWAIWPQTLEWWGLGLISIILWCGAFSCLVTGLKLIATVHARRRALADYMAQGGTPKSAQMASNKDLRRAGMVE